MIEDILTSFEGGATPARLMSLEKAVGTERFNKLIARLVANVSIGLPQEVSRDWRWCIDFETGAASCPALSSLFAIRGTVLDFAQGLSELQRAEIERKVSLVDKPRLMWHGPFVP